VLHFRAVQRTPGLWGRLQAEGSKEQLLARRNASIDAAHELEQQARMQRLERKQKEERCVSNFHALARLAWLRVL
jgi:hypothetical protein